MQSWTELRDASFFQELAARNASTVTAKTEGQRAYLEALSRSTITVCTGPAGTGKTYMACGHAARLLREGKVDRVILTKPLAECDEKTGFEPGDLRAKCTETMRPMLDAMWDFFGASELERLLTTEEILMVPLAKMRGRTFKRAVVVLDEAQNATRRQLKMFSTRMGEQSRIIVVGDCTQTDLPHADLNPLAEMVARYTTPEGHPDVSVVELTLDDVVRHPLLRWVIERWERKAVTDPPVASYNPIGDSCPCPACGRELRFPRSAELVHCRPCGAVVDPYDDSGRLDPVRLEVYE